MTQPRVAAKAQEVVEDNEQTEKAPDSKLYEELGELARFIDTTMKTLSEFSTPVSTSTEQLPQALTHLTNLKTMTEQGTHEVMRQVETIQDHHLKLEVMLKDLTQALQKQQTSPRYCSRFRISERRSIADDKRLLAIDGALVPDLVAQSVNKLDHSTGSRT